MLPVLFFKWVKYAQMTLKSAEVTASSDHIITQRAFEVQHDEKLMIYYKTCPVLNITNILAVILPQIHFDYQCLLCQSDLDNSSSSL